MPKTWQAIINVEAMAAKIGRFSILVGQNYDTFVLANF